MKRIFWVAAFILAGCNSTPMPPQNNAARTPSGNLQGVYAADGQDCNMRAQSRLALYDKPSTYPLSDQERKDAYQSLFSECMKEHSWNVADQKPQMANGADLAALSPAAGKPAVSPYPPGVVVIDTAHINQLAQAQGNNGGATVVVVQAQQPSAPNAPIVVQAPQAAAAPAQAQPVIIGSGPARAPQQPVMVGSSAQPSASELAAYSPAAGAPAQPVIAASTPTVPAGNPTAQLEHILNKAD